LTGGFVSIYNAANILIINKRGILKMRKKILNLKASWPRSIRARIRRRPAMARLHLRLFLIRISSVLA
jgi:hypothetical protein